MLDIVAQHNLFQVLEESAGRFSDRTALLFLDQKISYSQLVQMSNRLAQGLKNFGIKKQERVAILLHNCPGFVISYFAIVKLGAVCVTVNNMLTEDEIGYILRDSEAKIVITSVAYLETLNALKEKDLAGFEELILVDGIMPDTFNLYNIIERSPAKEEKIYISENDVATVLYTSGTTGNPKGAMLTHKNFISNARNCIAAIHATEKDNFICLLPMFHSFALTVCILMPILSGATITIIEHIYPFRRIVRSVVKKKVTVFAGIPSIFNLLAHMHIPAVFTSRILKMIDPLRICISGAAALGPEVLAAFEDKFKVPLLEGYGLTEAAPVVSLNPMKGKRKPGSVGLNLDDVEVKVVDEAGKDLNVGAVGELLVRGPNVMKGYLNREEATEETIKDDWLYTGDIAKIDEEGYIYIVDRKKDMINVRGLNVYPAEIEKILLKNPKVKEAAVVGVKDRFKGEVPKAFIVLRENQKVDSREIISYLKESLAIFKIPKFVEFRTNLPKNATGKILKHKL